MLTVISATNPKYTSNTENAGIDLMVEFAEFANTPMNVIPFHATHFDPHDHGVDLWTRARAGEFGPIAPYIEFSSTTASNNQPQSTGTQNV